MAKVTITNNMRGPRGFQHLDHHEIKVLGTDATETLNVLDTDLPMLRAMHDAKDITLVEGEPRPVKVDPPKAAPPPPVDVRRQDKIKADKLATAAAAATARAAEEARQRAADQADDETGEDDLHPALAFLKAKGLTEGDLEGMTDEEIEQRAVGLGYEPVDDEDEDETGEGDTTTDQTGQTGAGGEGDQDEDDDAPLDFEAMAAGEDGENKVRLYIETKTGTAPHPNKKLKGLLAQAEAIQSAERKKD